ncbi:MAG: hypothetical protein VYB52_05160 [Candidatus Neomarinimicrobiota bacterium]|nr:hypothetical protein [Candidatus Neomarinimicrobiota bacterium]MEC9007263.1 hypothetical protein [Candidatus Neomarinimicrobiota bacterium]MED5434223.1 hypothetical protein [Candidatus Neomarinimicrobiota bacterium]MEE3302372.1 hypothetical protein [Candidatus Neomarinimicrobiota bacterium]|tara:strand:+ start:1430 stop:2047 length:618 start_codon:yes stop_codon:yes gene_type:complete
MNEVNTILTLINEPKNYYLINKMNQFNTTKAALWWHRIRTRGKSGSNSLSLKKRGKLPIDFLIILPEHATESDLAKRFLDAMKNALGPRKKRNMKLLGPSGIGNIIEINEFEDYILYTEEDLNRWGLPGKELINTCQKIKVDAILDLNQEFATVSATITRTVTAPLKLGFYSEEGEKFYNIMVRRKGEELAESGFKEIFQILGIE